MGVKDLDWCVCEKEMIYIIYVQNSRISDESLGNKLQVSFHDVKFNWELSVKCAKKEKYTVYIKVKKTKNPNIKALSSAQNKKA